MCDCNKCKRDVDGLIILKKNCKHSKRCLELQFGEIMRNLHAKMYLSLAGETDNAILHKKFS